MADKVIMDEFSHFQDNAEAYEREAQLSKTILQRNRHSTHTGEWFGPDPEPKKPGYDCPCAGCLALYLMGSL